MRFSLFMYCTVGRRAELEAGMAGRNPELYQRMLDEIAEYVRFADDAGYLGFGHPEHHLQIEGFEISNDPRLMSMWLGRHSKKLRVITCGFVSTTHNPLRVAEDIATMDHMLGGRFGVGLVRGYQARWVENFKIRDELNAVGPGTRTRQPTPPTANTSPSSSHEHPVYVKYGQGVTAAMKIEQVGIAPRPLQTPHPPLYGGFAASMRTALFWAKYGGKPIILTDNLKFYDQLCRGYTEEAARHGRTVKNGQQAGWGGIFVCAPTDAQAQEWAKDMMWFWQSWATPFGQGVPELLVGSPDTICRRLEQVQKVIPDQDEVILLIPQGIHDRSQILTSLELMATKVMPKFA